MHPPFVPFVVMLQTDFKRGGRGVRGDGASSSAFSACSALKPFPGSGLHYCASKVRPLYLETPDRLARHSPVSIRLVDPKRSRVDCHPNHGSREAAKTRRRTRPQPPRQPSRLRAASREPPAGCRQKNDLSLRISYQPGGAGTKTPAASRKKIGSVPPGCSVDYKRASH